MPMDGKHALITGSSRGIGRGIALKHRKRYPPPGAPVPLPALRSSGNARSRRVESERETTSARRNARAVSHQLTPQRRDRQSRILLCA
jgi:hypothetical protein